MKVGIFALQGDVSEHKKMLHNAGKELGMAIKVVELRDFENFNCDALIIPGGESTAMRRLTHDKDSNKFLNFLKKISGEGIPIMGTCAGLILLAKNVDGKFYDGLLDIEVKRNDYGRQRESFEEDIDLNLNGTTKFHAIFIRAPVIEKVNKGEILADFEGKVVAVKDENVIGLTFHPELTNNTKIYKYFLNLI
ncbi:MAG: glutamine amidotransferase subunit PdxT [Candidatus Altiarchaeales archaeon A3]|nr:MAG: glutamine amidotransferase subunit PdxT [Candidatus Altiarchaeales archaeon A3]